MMLDLPRKLKKDAIVEALWEVRFGSDELPELVVGTLAGNQAWRHYGKTRLALSDVPAAIRNQDPKLRYQATLQLVSREPARIIKIGSNVFSYHILRPYCGGEQFETELSATIDFVFGSLANFKATRLGLRYINAMSNDHHIENINDLELTISVAGDRLEPPLNLNYRRASGESHFATVRIVSPEFLTTLPQVALNALIDIDVFTSTTFESSDAMTAKEWVASARTFEKTEFFRLIPAHILERLREY
jgi:uncharacterized protein (TIGR04255 family)